MCENLKVDTATENQIYGRSDTFIQKVLRRDMFKQELKQWR